MKFALFVAGAAMVSAQCAGEPAATCTAARNCTYTPDVCQVSSVNITFKCDTTSMTCGPHCAPGPAVTDFQTCSKCTPVCNTVNTATACGGDSICEFINASCTGVQTLRCSSTTKAGCTAEANCFWTDVSVNVCNANEGGGLCGSCTGNYYTLAMRSGLKNLVGKTCTHAKAGAYSYSFGYTVKDYAQNSMCVATTAADATADMAGLLALVNQSLYGNNGLFDPSSAAATCVAAPAPSPSPSESDASMLLPSAAFLALATLLA